MKTYATYSALLLTASCAIANPIAQFMDAPPIEDNPGSVGVDASDKIPPNGSNDTTYSYTFQGISRQVQCTAFGAQQIDQTDRGTLTAGWNAYKAMTPNSGGPYLPNAIPKTNIMYFHTNNNDNEAGGDSVGHGYCDSCMTPNINSGMNNIWCQVSLGAEQGLVTDCMSNSNGNCQGNY